MLVARRWGSKIITVPISPVHQERRTRREKERGEGKKTEKLKVDRSTWGSALDVPHFFNSGRLFVVRQSLGIICACFFPIA